MITAYSSDGRIVAFDLVTLEDERGAIPPYDAVVLAGPRLARERPDVLAAVARLEGRLDVARMRRAEPPGRRRWTEPGRGGRGLPGLRASARGATP